MGIIGFWTRSAGLLLGAVLVAGLLFLAGQALRIDLSQPGTAAPEPSIFVGDKADWLLDRGEIGVIDAATLPGILARLTPSNGKMPGVGLRFYEGAKLWVRFDMPALADAERWVVRLANTRVREARLVLIKHGAFTDRDWSYDSAERRAGLATRTPAFEFSRAELDGAQVLLGFNSLGAMRGAVSVETGRAYDAFENRQTMVYSLLLGIMWALAAYLLVIGTRLGERSLVFAAGLSFTLGVFVYGVGGYVHSMLLTPWPKLADVVLYGLQPWPPAFWMLLAISYLDLRHRAPRTGLVLTVIALILPFQGILTLMTAMGYPIPFITDNATPVMIGIAAGLAPVIWYTIRGDRRARMLLLAFTPIGVGSIIRVVNYFTPSPDPVWTAAMDLYADMVVTVVLLAAVIVIDIQRREAALRAEATHNEQRFRAYAEIASDSYFETDAQGLVVGAAGRVTRDLGLIEGSRLETVLAGRVEGEAEPVLGQFRRAVNTGERLSDLEIATQKAEGGRGWLSFNLVPYEPAAGARGLRGTITDVTERVERREREGRQNTLSALGQLASGVAHEVNNLLHPMVNLAQRVRDKHTSDEEARKLLDLVVASGKHAGEIVAGVLNSFNPIRTPGERLPIAEALDKALATVRPTVPATITIAETIAPGGLVTVPPGEMLQVVSNLLSNAIRAMDGSGRIEVSLAPSAEGAVLRFADNGPGMPEHIRRRASEPFVTGRADGTGLGLSVVANIVRSWRGEMDIQSAPDSGTAIVMRIAAPPETPA